ERWACGQRASRIHRAGALTVPIRAFGRSDTLDTHVGELESLDRHRAAVALERRTDPFRRIRPQTPPADLLLPFLIEYHDAQRLAGPLSVYHVELPLPEGVRVGEPPLQRQARLLHSVRQSVHELVHTPLVIFFRAHLGFDPADLGEAGGRNP